ncbi:PAS domain S-box-containing protein [Rhodoblastus acidophilus]|uniref:PAS domain-containing protein n=1 Tax=Rhodoblastus acidophilus TaxID=1074 RepID=UPI0022241C1E|nr:PAS domain-containing protein [Rhodoblastus acidophilus]MCW2318912.1 PAS domain S-box-containing protein [Rhodoblastus acidophilus]
MLKLIPFCSKPGPLRQKLHTHVALTGVERTFAPSDIIVSKTDPKGVITYANKIFLDVAQLTERQAIGAAHSIVRHPDMPRAVFALLWSRLQAGQEIFAYVLNMASSGDHYWVHAHVTPTFGADDQIIGYHSNRRVPTRSAVDAIAPIYRELKAIEDRAANRADGLKNSVERLHAILRNVGVSYDQYVFSLAS